MSVIDNLRYKVELDTNSNNAQYIVSQNSFDERINYFIDSNTDYSNQTMTLTSEVLLKKDA